MSKVKILPPDVIAKIAAGEVIERPASVVKELVENALDAKSTSIELKLKDAGKTLIHIKDNGSGIATEDLSQLFHRHATSKISNFEDLFAIHSLGFRGEALFSIGAVSDVTLKSKPASQSEGWAIHLRGGEQIALKPAAVGSSGTEIEIKELFYNTPARRKFLKSNSAEIQQILHAIIPYCLLHHTCRFKVNHQGKDLLDLASAKDKKDRIADALNLDANNLIEAQQSFPERNASLSLILGNINIQRTRRDMQFLFVNGRPVDSKNIMYHINQVYRLIMPPETYPFFAIFIDLPPAEIDVNVHPTKREVKIHNEQNLCSLLRHMCEGALMTHGQIRRIQENAQTQQHVSTNNFYARPLSRELPLGTSSQDDMAGITQNDYAYPQAKGSEEQSFFFPQDNLLFEKQDTFRSKLENAVFVGNFRNKYLLFQTGNSLLVMDQHATAERITFEKLIRQMEKGTVEVQNLLSPVLLKVTAQEMALWEEGKEKFEELGFSTTQLDEETLAVHAYPVLIKDIEKAMRHLLSGEDIARSDFETLARRACRASIMTGDQLKPQQAEFIREELLNCKDPFTCPHGRPTVIEVSENFFDKQFFRC